MVFALAATHAGVDFSKARERDHDHFDEFTAFDVWCAGLGNKAFKHMTDCDLVSYQLLLERSLWPHDAFELQDEGRGSLRQRMAPLTTDNDAHHAIHLRGSESGHKRQATSDDEEQNTRKRSKHTAVEETDGKEEIDGEEETDKELDSGDLDMEAESAAWFFASNCRAYLAEVLYQCNQFGCHGSQALKISEKFRKSQVTGGLSESVPDTVTLSQLKKIVTKLFCSKF
jgi:hypothetical protein